METPIGDDEDSHLGEFIEDNATLSPSEAAMFSSLRDVTEDLLAGLTKREAKALRKLRHPSRSEKLRSFLDNSQ